MKFYKRLKVYKASNVVYDPVRQVALSYNWWEFVKPIKGKLVFNTYGYSTSTRKHQYKVRQLLSELGQTVNLAIEAPNGLQDLQSALNHYDTRIRDLQAAMDRPRAHKVKNYERAQLIGQLRNAKRCVRELME